MKLSSRVQNIAESVTLKLNSKAVQLADSGRTIYNLTAGQLPFKPMDSFVDHLRSELDNVKSFQYSPAAGYLELRKKMIKNIEDTRNISFSSLDEEFDCLVSNGAKHCLTNVFASLIDQGDEVIMMAPYWISYSEMIKMCKGSPVVVKSGFENNFLPSIDDIKKSITEKTKIIVINSPNNPSGTYYSDEWMCEFAKLMEENPNICVISDEIYYELCYDGPTPTFFYQKNPELLKRTIIIDGISKTLACTGLRIGYCIAPKNVISAMAKLQGQTASGANSLVQRAMLHFDFNMTAEFLAPIKKHLKQNADIVKTKFEKAGLGECWYHSNSAFYYMIDFSKTPLFKKISNGSDQDIAADICDKLLEESGVATVPGTDFGLSNAARISLVLDSENFEKALDKVIDYLS